MAHREHGQNYYQLGCDFDAESCASQTFITRWMCKLRNLPLNAIHFNVVMGMEMVPINDANTRVLLLLLLHIACITDSAKNHFVALELEQS